MSFHMTIINRQDQEDIQQLRAKGLAPRTIAQKLGLPRAAVQFYCDTNPTPEARSKGRPRTCLKCRRSFVVKEPPSLRRICPSCTKQVNSTATSPFDL